MATYCNPYYYSNAADILAAYKKKSEEFDKEFDRRMSIINGMIRGLQTSNSHPVKEAIDSLSPSPEPEVCVPVETDMISNGSSDAIEVKEDSGESELDSKTAEFYFGAVKVDAMVESVGSASAEIDLASIDMTDKSDSATATGDDGHDLDVHLHLDPKISAVIDFTLQEVTLNRLPVVNRTVSITKADQYDDLNEELRSETSLGDLICCFNFRTSTVWGNASMNWPTPFIMHLDLSDHLKHIPLSKKKVRVLKPPAKPPDIIYTRSLWRCGDLGTACEVLKEMKKCGFLCDEHTFGSVLKDIAKGFGLRYGQQVHTEVLKCGYRENVYAGSALLDMYAKCKRMEDAHVVFDCMPVRNSVSWNALIAGYAELGEYEMVIQLFGDIECEGVRIDDGTLAPLLALLNDPSFRKLTMQVHGKVMKSGLAFKIIVCNALINSYSEGGSLEDAKHVFDGMAGFQDLVTWNSLLAAYVVHKQGVFALKVFSDMQASGFEPDVYTFTSVISCSLDDELGKSFHGLIFKKGLERSVPISNSLMSMYLKSDSKSLEDALRIYESMEKRDQVSWNSILAGFSQNGLSENALECFKQMLLELVEIDQYAFSAVFKACSDLATLQWGQQVHNLAMKMGTDVFDYVVSSLIFMYCKCDCIEDARKAFDETPQDSAIIWNSIIFGFAQHGQGNAALDLFYSMRNRLVKPDHITFVAVLTACSHIGLLGKVAAYGGAVQGLIMSVESPSAFIEDKTINQKNKFGVLGVRNSVGLSLQFMKFGGLSGAKDVPNTLDEAHPQSLFMVFVKQCSLLAKVLSKIPKGPLKGKNKTE
ncbi:hypothetical protein QQ045_001691 [Rhodiola kirilowii]